MKRLLVVVDMQKDFIDGSLGSEEARAIVPNVIRKMEEYREAGDEIVFTLDSHGEDYLETQEGKKLPVAHCVKGTQGWNLDKAIETFEGLRFEKSTFGSLSCTHYISRGEYTSVELVGLCTDICVISNAMLIKAALPEAIVKVKASCCAGVSRESHENALEAMRMCQIEICP